MHARRVLAGTAALALSLAGASCRGSEPSVRIDTTTLDRTSLPTTTVAPTTTSEAPQRLARASRSLARPRPAPDVREHADGLPPIMLRIRWCESRNNYTAENRRSTASGAWQFLDSSWARYAGYERAMYAPPEVQDQKALNVYNAVGTRPWNASRSCWG